MMNTQKILKNKYKEVKKNVKLFEQKYGIIGLSNIEVGIEEMTKAKGDVDIIKGKTLEELSKIVVQLIDKIQDRKGNLQHILEDNKRLKVSFKQ